MNDNVSMHIFINFQAFNCFRLVYFISYNDCDNHHCIFVISNASLAHVCARRTNDKRKRIERNNTERKNPSSQWPLEKTYKCTKCVCEKKGGTTCRVLITNHRSRFAARPNNSRNDDDFRNRNREICRFSNLQGKRHIHKTPCVQMCAIHRLINFYCVGVRLRNFRRA